MVSNPHFLELLPGFAEYPDLANACSGRSDVDDVLELQRRQSKAQLLSYFQADLKDFVRAAVYRSGSDPHSNEKLSAALQVANAAIRAGGAQLEREGGLDAPRPAPTVNCQEDYNQLMDRRRLALLEGDERLGAVLLKQAEVLDWEN